MYIKMVEYQKYKEEKRIALANKEILFAISCQCDGVSCHILKLELQE